MLTKDFIKAVEELDYKVDNRWSDCLYVETLDDEPFILATISKFNLNSITWNRGTQISVSDAVSLVKLVEEYANTPVEEREEVVASKSLQDYELEELCEAISKKLLKEYDPNVQVVISQKRISFYEPKWSIPSEWAFENL
ncbi:hypothetical protein [Enterococcus phage SAP6]|uniref:Uncharacterized protein n=1 Tax=Enterococcus phage SAP6 TaxID=1073766 RepID=G1C4X2_9CAUD|nr:hypothetical protein FDH85_gp16 [Enterococcus phage SAP6]AEM24753.1 hypothetical protein [Enterococcus phage SAP6]